MARFKQHLPGFVEGFEPGEFEFQTTEELLRHPLLAEYAAAFGFSHFAISDELVMAVYADGENWLVAGYVSDPDSVDLPKWRKGKSNTPDHIDDIKAGSAFRESLLTKADAVSSSGAPMWHGWAIMDAYLAGVRAERARAALAAAGTPG